MNIVTKYLGEIKIDKEQVIYFENGLPGFSEEKEFVFLPLSEDGLFSFLQSVTNKALAFITTNPFLFHKRYEFELTDADQKLLNIKNSNDVFVQVIVTLNETLEDSTANFKAPLIINNKEKIAKQVILDTYYESKHKLINSLPGGEESC
jgi:flagellar assembly factor FliW